MAIFKKNVFSLFYIILILGASILFVLVYEKYNEVTTRYTTFQESSVKKAFIASHTILATQEMMLDLLGKQMLKNKDDTVLDEMISINPSIAAFGLADLDGNLIKVSANLRNKKLPNLKANPNSRKTFLKALKSDVMVLGTTYYLKPLKAWIIPIRKTIKDKASKPIGVMTAGFSLNGSNKYFNNSMHQKGLNSITLIREDRNIQYISSDNPDRFSRYKVPVPKKVYNSAMNIVMKQSGASEESLKKNELLVSYETLDKFGETLLVSMKFDSRYRYWIASTTNKKNLLKEVKAFAMKFFLLYVGLMILIYILFKDIDRAQKRRREDLEYQATHDPLTKLSNRNYIQHNYKAWTKKGAKSFALFFIDLDRFKNVNDSFGHTTGDKVLIEVVSRLNRFVDEKSKLIREGGDEFIFLTSECNTNVLLELARKMIKEVSRAYKIHDFTFTLGASIGIALFPKDGESFDDILRSADIAMYKAKKFGNHAELFTGSFQDEYIEKLKIEHDLKNSLESDEISLVYQPQITKDLTLCGVEALVRWNHKQRGFIPPDKFIPIAESAGLMPQLGKKIIDTALKEIKEITDVSGKELTISINISIQQFMEGDFFGDLLKKITKSKVPKSSICLEITETLFIEDVNYILPLLNEIKKEGIKISLDDFGTGYSSLGILKSLPIDELKIDKSFVDNIVEDSQSRNMVKNVIAIGKNLNLSVLAEGVETIEQKDFLKNNGCDMFQGYFFSKPLKKDDLVTFIKEYKIGK